jgi:cell division protein FtsN
MKNQRGGFALGLIVGLLLGLAVALGVALYVTKTPVPLMNKGQQRTPEQDAAEVERNKTWDPNAALAGRQAVRPAAPPAPAAASDTAVVPRSAPVVVDTTAGVKPLPASAPPLPRPDLPPPQSKRDAAAILAGQPVDDGSEGRAAATAGTDPFIYFVQVGAYSRPEDADQQRAKLAMAGLRATISDREQNGRTVHRVRLGPFDKKDDADAQTERAKAVDAEATLVRVERSKQ